MTNEAKFEVRITMDNGSSEFLINDRETFRLLPTLSNGMLGGQYDWEHQDFVLSEPIPLDRGFSKYMQFIIDNCKKYVAMNEMETTEIKEYTELMKMTLEELKELAALVAFLQAMEFQDVVTKVIALKMEDMSREEMLMYVNDTLDNDGTRTAGPKDREWFHCT